MGIGKNKLFFFENKVKQKTFIEYINELRVDLAKQLLQDEKYNSYTITP